jgi:hypothetical protein
MFEFLWTALWVLALTFALVSLLGIVFGASQ